MPIFGVAAPSSRSAKNHRAKLNGALPLLAAPILALNAGYVDAISYLSMHVFAANMTGTVVLLGLALADWHLYEAMFCLGAVVALLSGIITSRTLVHLSQGSSLPLAVTALVLLADIGTSLFGRMTVFPLAFAMGMQNASITRFGGINLNTSFITGGLERLGEALVERAGTSRRRITVKLLLISVPFAYALGAAAGAVSHRNLAQPLFVSVVGLLIAASAARWYRRTTHWGKVKGQDAADS
jgi:uncharacterized membrane protein YoaK (UPF0700 family)